MKRARSMGDIGDGVSPMILMILLPSSRFIQGNERKCRATENTPLIHDLQDRLRSSETRVKYLEGVLSKGQVRSGLQQIYSC